MDQAGLITLEQDRAAGLSFDEPEPRACPHCGAALGVSGRRGGGVRHESAQTTFPCRLRPMCARDRWR